MPFHSHWVYTMHRCAVHRPARRAAVRSLLLAAVAPLSATWAWRAQAQTEAVPQQRIPRRFPRNALRGEVGFASYPELLLNGKPARLAPGARVKDANNLAVIPNQVQGKKYVVNYTLDTTGYVHDVWILRPDEIANPWPRSPQEAQGWIFQEATQTWVRP